MQARPLKDDGCTVIDAPYKEEDLDASKLGVDTSFPVLRSPWLKVASDFVKAPVYSTSITPNSPWLVPMMFGPNISGGASSALLNSSTVTGCFQKGNSPQPSHEGGSNANRELIFDASSVNVIYGNGMTVQPASLELLACIRV